MINWKALMEAAVKARERAYAPYSHFHVGAAGLADDDNIYSGCNVENVAYPLCSCAERGMVHAMIAGGGRRLVAVYVVGGDESKGPAPVKPCGGCRQILYEFGGVGIFVNAEDKTTGKLLPDAFGPEFKP